MKILAATDGSELSFKALKEAASIASMINGEVAIIYVEDPVPHPDDKGYYFSEDSLKQYEARRKEDREKILGEAEQIFQAKGLPFNTVVKKGRPADIIKKVASEEGYDLIVLGSRGLGGLNQLLLGSVSNAVAQQSESSVLIVR